MVTLKRIHAGVAAITMFHLSHIALGCLELSGQVSDGFEVAGYITAVDNGVQTCSGDIGSGDQNVGCISGYSLNYDYSDNPQAGPLPITYCNPENCYGIEIPLDCVENNNCCGGNIPCTCYSCQFGYSTFC